jgi:hypothetical protein
MIRRSRALLLVLSPACLSLACPSPVWSQTPTIAQTTPCDSLDSPAGRDWATTNLWRYPSRDQAATAFRTLADSASPSPWPDWYQPQQAVLPAGTHIQMALGPDQVGADGATLRYLGRWATLQPIGTAANAWAYLAIRHAFKPKGLAWVATFEVVRPITVAQGPVGPQVEPDGCHLLPGGWYQIQFTGGQAEQSAALHLIALAPLP